MSITIKDIARLAGVDASTVSRSLNNSPRVAPKTKERILKIAKDTGFEFNSQARNLILSKSNTIGVIFNAESRDSQLHLFSNLLHKQMLKHLEKEGLDVIVTYIDETQKESNNIIRLINRKKVDGLILMEQNIDLKTIDFIKKSKIPFIFCHYILNKDEDVNGVTCNHFTGGYLACEHLIKSGHKKILCVQREGNSTHFKQRTQGFIAALQDYNVDFDDKNFVYTSKHLNEIYQFTKNSIDFFKQFTAVFSHTDTQALALIKALTEANIKMPEEMSIIGYDNIPLGEFYEPYLTTIQQPVEEIVGITCERLVTLLETKNKKIEQIYLEPKLIIRDSVVNISNN